MRRDLSSFRKVKLVAFDFDGVFTDNKVYVDQNGKETVCCWRSDGIGLSRLKEVGVKTVVITAEANPVVKKRCVKLGINCVDSCKIKLPALKRIIHEQNLSPGEVCFVGNDVPDLDCLKYVGCAVAVKGSVDAVLGVADYITQREGGAGAVREVCDVIFNQRRK